MYDKTMIRGLLAAALMASAVSVQAQNTITLDMVPVGNAGNAADTTGYGAVSYNYNIGKYDVTTAQYTAFLNAVAKTDKYGLYNSVMATDFPTAGISRSGVSGSYSYSVTGTAPGATNMPVFDVSWGDAARFCNWLQNGQPTGGQSLTTTESGACYLNGATTTTKLMAVLSPSHSGANAARYFLPSEDEWYKAAYYKTGGTNAGYWTYPTKSDSVPSNVLSPTGTNNANFLIGNGVPVLTDPINWLTPVGSFVLSPGPYGTFDQGGDLFQWNEAAVTSSARGVRGGDWAGASNNVESLQRLDGFGPTFEGVAVGFRVASSEVVPEPGSIALLLAGAVAFGIWRLRRNA